MAHPRLLGDQIVLVLRTYGHRESMPGHDLHPQGPQPRALLRIRRQQPYAAHAQVRQDGGGDVVRAGVDRQAQLEIGVDGVESVVLEGVRVQLGAESDAASFVAAKIDQRTRSLAADLLQGRIELLAAVTAPGAEGIPRQALRVHPDQRRVSLRGRQVPAHQGDVLLTVGRHVAVQPEQAVRRGQNRRHDPAHHWGLAHRITLTQTSAVAAGADQPVVRGVSNPHRGVDQVTGRPPVTAIISAVM